jgi:hypothetical protein
LVGACARAARAGSGFGFGEVTSAPFAAAAVPGLPMFPAFGCVTAPAQPTIAHAAAVIRAALLKFDLFMTSSFSAGFRSRGRQRTVKLCRAPID